MKMKSLSKSFLGLVLLILVPGLLWAATGKIRGTVTDAETGEPLMMANVIIEGTNMGAASDENGEYIILNVPTGKYTLICTYMGYQKVTIQDVIVNSGLTSFKDFALPKIVLEGQEVVIVADRPLIDKNETNEIHYVRAEDLDQMPIRGITQAITSMAGVIDDGGIHVRGGRADEVAYYVDGVNTSNAFGGEQIVTVIHSAIEEVQMQTGGFTAEYGGKMSGITVTTTKTGGPKYNIMAEVISDDFWSIENDAGEHRILGIKDLYSYGYNTYTLTLGGPIVPMYKDLRFFVAVENWNRGSAAYQYEGFHQDSIQAYALSTNRHGLKHYDTLDVYIDQPAGRLPGGGDWGLTVNGNLVWDLKPVRVKVGGSWAISRSTPQTTSPGGILTVGGNYSENHPYNYNAYVNVTHTISPTMFYTLSGSYTTRGNEYGPNNHEWDNTWEALPGAPAGSGWEYNPTFTQWGDPNYNTGLLDTSLGYSSFYMPWDPSFTIGHSAKGDSFDAGSNNYGKYQENKWTGKFDMTMQLGKRHEVRFGGEYSQGLYRQYAISSASLLWNQRNIMLTPDAYSEYDIYQAYVTMRGYDWQGNPINEDMIVSTKIGQPEALDINLRNAPPRPKNGGVYIQDKVELRDLIINAGLRFDYINYGHPSFTSLDSLTMGPGGVVAEENWLGPKVYTYISPRLGFSFPVTDQAVFHAQYGRYIQAPDLSLTWTYRSYSDFVEYLYGGVYFAPLQNPNLRPEKTTNYEFGFQMQFGASASLDVTAFYKDTKDLITERTVLPLTADYRTPTFMYNGDFGTVKGFTATFNLRRTSRIQATLAYTFSNAEGTGSTAGEHFAIAWQEEDPHFPKIIAPLDFDQRHKGTIVVDARTQPEDGPEIFGVYPFGRWGLNLMFSFNSGSPYTRIPAGSAFSSVYGFNAPPPTESPMASSTPWFYQLDGKLDRTFVIGPVKLNAYLWGINFLGLKCVTGVFAQTGRPDTDGYLESEGGKERIQDIADNYGPEYAEYYQNWYNAVLTSCGTYGWQTPRQIRFGLKFEL